MSWKYFHFCVFLKSFQDYSLDVQCPTPISVRRNTLMTIIALWKATQKRTMWFITVRAHKNHHALWSANLFEALTLCTSLISIPSSLCGTKYPETAEGFLSAATLNCLERVSSSVASSRAHVPWNDWDASVNGFIRNGFETAERTVKWSPSRWIGWV